MDRTSETVTDRGTPEAVSPWIANASARSMSMSNSTVLGRTLLVEPGAGASSVLAGSLSSKMALLPASDAAIFSEFELLAGTKKPKTVVFGKHIRVIVSPDGMRVKSVTPLSETELELSAQSVNGTPAALTVTHLVTDYPLETHVFASMSSRLPLYVGTSRGTWLVDYDSIQLLDFPK